MVRLSPLDPAAPLRRLSASLVLRGVTTDETLLTPTFVASRLDDNDAREGFVADDFTTDVTTEAPSSAPQPSALMRRRRLGMGLLCLVIVLAALVWGLNTLRIDRPVSQALSSDSRNTGFSLRAHYRYYLDPSALVLDLREADSVSPLDLYRGTFQSAKALHEAGRRFDRVVFARSGAPVFWMTGEDFQSLGREYAAGENPLYLIRTLPGHLHRPDGEPFSHSQGGMASPFDEANEAMRRWIRGS